MVPSIMTVPYESWYLNASCICGPATVFDVVCDCSEIAKIASKFMDNLKGTEYDEIVRWKTDLVEAPREEMEKRGVRSFTGTALSVSVVWWRVGAKQGARTHCVS